MPQFSLYLFGPPRLERDGQPVPIERRKVTALLSYLALMPQPHSRDSLATLLWPGYGQKDARAHLRRTLSELNKVIGKERLETTRQTIRLHKNEDSWVDVWQFERLLASCQTHGHDESSICEQCLIAIEEAVALYQNDFLAGFTLADSEDFDDWQTVQSEQLRQQLFGSLEKLVSGYSESGQFEQAIAHAQRWLAIDPLHEPAHRHLMQLYAWRGDRVTAVTQYQECVRLLAEELAVEPSETTTQLYEQIRAGEIEAPTTTPIRLTPSTSILTSVSTSSPPPTNLPAQLTPFYGREEELARLQTYLDNDETRLVTIVGEGGVGKSRLALAAAEQRMGRYEEGVWFISMVDIVEPTGANQRQHQMNLLATSIAEVLGLALVDSEQISIQEQVLSHIQNQEMLFILDNFEHLMLATDFVIELLRRAPNVQVMVTSRESLMVQAEHLLRLSGLPLPPHPDQSSDERHDEDYRLYASIQLFVERVQRHLPDFEPTPANLLDIAHICGSVMGLPLGIELAAAWAGHYTCAEIAASLKKRDLDFLAVPHRDIPDRHRSLRAIFDYSWDLLDPSNQQSLAQLSVFRGNIQRQAALEVTQATMHDLIALVNKSLLRQTAPGQFEMHNLLRQFAAEKLDALDPEKQVQTKHATYFLHYVQQNETQLFQSEGTQATTNLQAVFGNVRKAQHWAMETNDWNAFSGAVPGLMRFYQLKHLYQEGLEVFGFAQYHIRMLTSDEARATASPEEVRKAEQLFNRIRPFVAKRRKRSLPFETNFEE